jgi:hypothetical protein
VPLRVCTVSFKSATGISHSVDVEAETLYEAAGLGLARLKNDGWIEGLGPGTRLEIAVREPATVHSLTVQQLQKWVNGITSSPADVLRRTKVKHLLATAGRTATTSRPLAAGIRCCGSEPSVPPRRRGAR